MSDTNFITDKLRQLVHRWELEQSQYPATEGGRYAASAVRCCANELREALATPPASGNPDDTTRATTGERQVGCEGEDGLLRTHAESETCDVCATDPTPTVTTEQLRHYRCSACSQWWSISDGPERIEGLYCPACGHRQGESERTEASEALEELTHYLNYPNVNDYPEEHANINHLLAQVRRALTASRVPVVPEAVRRLPEKMRQAAEHEAYMNREGTAYVLDYWKGELERALADAQPGIPDDAEKCPFCAGNGYVTDKKHKYQALNASVRTWHGPSADEWVLVPKEPTTDMALHGMGVAPLAILKDTEGGQRQRVSLNTDHCKEIYRAMIDAELGNRATRNGDG